MTAYCSNRDFSYVRISPGSNLLESSYLAGSVHSHGLYACSLHMLQHGIELYLSLHPILDTTTSTRFTPATTNRSAADKMYFKFKFKFKIDNCLNIYLAGSVRLRVGSYAIPMCLLLLAMETRLPLRPVPNSAYSTRSANHFREHLGCRPAGDRVDN